MLGVLDRASAQHGGTGWARRLLDSEVPNLLVVLKRAAERQRPAGELLRRTGDIWVWLLARGNLGQATGAAKLIRSWPTAGLRGERDTMAWHWLRMVAQLNDGQLAAQVGALIEARPGRP